MTSPGTQHAYGEAPSQFGELHLAEGPGPHPVAVLVHGGYWKNERGLRDYPTIELIDVLRQRGHAVWNIEYRRLGEDGGGYPETIADAGRAIDALRALAPTHALDLERITVIGHSAGGHIALWLASRANIAADNVLHTSDPLLPQRTIAIAGIPDLRSAWHGGLSNDTIMPRMMPGTPDEHADAYAAASPIELLPPAGAITVMHGANDETVEFAQSSRYVRALRATGGHCDFDELTNGDHFSMLTPGTDDWQRLLALLA